MLGENFLGRVVMFLKMFGGLKWLFECYLDCKVNDRLKLIWILFWINMFIEWSILGMFFLNFEFLNLGCGFFMSVVY